MSDVEDGPKSTASEGFYGAAIILWALTILYILWKGEMPIGTWLGLGGGVFCLLLGILNDLAVPRNDETERRKARHRHRADEY